MLAPEKELIARDEVMFRAAVENGVSLVVVTDVSGNIQYVNPRVLEQSGFSEEELIGAPPTVLGTLLPPDDGTVWPAIRAGRPWQGESLGRRKDGTTYYALTTVTPIRSDDGTVTHFLGIGLDITEKKQAEFALEESESRFRALLEAVPTAAFLVGVDARILYANSAGARTLGCDPASIVGRPYIDFLHPAYAGLAARIGFNRLHGGPAPGQYEVRFIRAGGEARWGLASSTRVEVDGGPALLSTLIDVTDQKAAEVEVRESESRGRQLLMNAPAALFVVEDGLITFINSAAARILDYEPGEIQGREMAFLIHPADLERLRGYAVARATGGYVPSRYTGRFLNKQGESRWGEVSISAIDLDGRRAMLGTVIDVTDRVLAEEGRRESESQLRALIAAAPGFITVLDREGKFLSINKILPGLVDADVIGRSSLDFVDEEFREDWLRAIARVFETGSTVTFEAAGYGPGGARSIYQNKMGPVLREGRVEAVMLVSLDVTESRRTEEELAALREEVENRTADRFARANRHNLTFRETMVLNLVACGKSDREIAETLGISRTTANKHVGNVLRKMNAGTRAEAAARAARDGTI